MKKNHFITSIIVLAATAAFSANASQMCTTDANNATGQLITAPCSDVTLIDFNQDAQAESASIGLSGWAKINDAYVKSTGETSANFINNNASYNYQGIAGTSDLSLVKGETITVWFTNSSTTDAYDFYPSVSFDDPDRPISGAKGVWFEFNTPTTIYPQQSLSVKFIIDKPVTASVVNVNTGRNGDGQMAIGVDKIEYTRIADADRVASQNNCLAQDGTPTYGGSCNKFTLLSMEATFSDMATKGNVSLFDTLNVSDNYFRLSGTSINPYSYASTGAKHTTNNVAYVDSGELNEHSEYVGVRSSANDTFNFKAGDVILVTYAVEYPADPLYVNPKISFDDSDSIPYGDTGTWYDMTIDSYVDSTVRNAWFVFDETTAGDFSLVNTILDLQSNSQFGVTSIQLYTERSFNVTF